MAFLTSATATATVAQNTNSVAITGMDINQVQPGMALYLGARDRAKGDGLIIATVTPNGSNGGTILLVGSVDTAYTNAAFLIDTIAYVGSGAVLQVEADYQVLNALRTFGGTNTNLAAGNRQLWLDKKLASSVSYLAFAIGGVLYGRLQQRTVTYTPTGGTTTTTEAISLRTSADGTILTDAIFVDTATGGVDVLADSVAMVAAALTDLSSARKKKVTITGTMAITSFGPGKHLERLITFQDAGLVLTYNATSLKLPTLANITTRAGDTCHATSDGSGNWHVRDYTRADGTPVIATPFIKTLLDDPDAATALLTLGAQSALGFTPIQQGGGVGQLANKLNLGWSAAPGLRLSVDGTDVGKVWTDYEAQGSVSAAGDYNIQRFPSGLAIITGSSVVNLDAFGRATIPVGLTAAAANWLAIATNGDYQVGGETLSTGNYSSSYFSVAFQGTASSVRRVHWIAFGRWK